MCPGKGVLKVLPAAVALLLSACGDPVLHASDASIEAMFRHNQSRLTNLIQMAKRDKVQVLWLMTHESQPSDNVLSDERWQAYDAIMLNTGVRSLHRTKAGFEMCLTFGSDGFMKEGIAKGILYSQNPVQPLVASLDEGVPGAMATVGGRTAYKRMAQDWYLFVREE